MDLKGLVRDVPQSQDEEAGGSWWKLDEEGCVSMDEEKWMPRIMAQ